MESFWPTSIVSWLTAGTLATAVGKTGYDWLTGRRKSLAALDGKIAALDTKMDNVCGGIDDMEGRLQAVDGLAQTVRELVFEWRGVDGQNGYKSIIRENSRRLNAIEKRNDRIDAVREEEMRRGGGHQRRHMDRELNNLMPEEREEKP